MGLPSYILVLLITKRYRINRCTKIYKKTRNILDLALKDKLPKDKVRAAFLKIAGLKYESPTLNIAKNILRKTAEAKSKNSRNRPISFVL